MKKTILVLTILMLTASAAADDTNLSDLTDTEPLYDTENPDNYGDLLFGFTNEVTNGMWAHIVTVIVFAVPMGSFLGRGFDTRNSFLTSTFITWLISVLLWAGDYLGEYAVSFWTVLMLLGIGIAYEGGGKV